MSVVCHLAAELGINHRPGEFHEGGFRLEPNERKTRFRQGKTMRGRQKAKPYGVVLYALFLPNPFPRASPLRKKFPCGDVLFQERCVTVRGI